MHKKNCFSLSLSLCCLAFFFLVNSCAKKGDPDSGKAPAPLKVLVMTGGHGYDTLDFHRLFGQMENLNIDHVLLEPTTAFFDDISDRNYEVLVFYNFRNKLTETGKANFLQLGQQGIGMVFLHHSVMGFDDWPAFRDIVGAKYFYPGEAPEDQLGNYKHDVNVNVKIVDPDHPITQGIDDFQLFDEVYGNYWVSEENHLLMTTNHPDSQPEIGWTRQYLQSKVVFLQPGHGKEALRDERYRELVERAIWWSTGGLERPSS